MVILYKEDLRRRQVRYQFANLCDHFGVILLAVNRDIVIRVFCACIQNRKIVYFIRSFTRWCNGNTEGFGPSVGGSSPPRVARHDELPETAAFLQSFLSFFTQLFCRETLISIKLRINLHFWQIICKYGRENREKLKNELQNRSACYIIIHISVILNFGVVSKVNEKGGG